MSRGATPPRLRSAVALTRTGAKFVGLTVLVGAAAANTGANLLYLILALLISTLVYAFARARRALSDVALDVDCPALIEAGQAVSAVVRVTGLRARSARLSSGLPLLPVRGLHAPLTAELQTELALAFATRPARRQVVDGFVVRIATRWPFHLLTRSRTLHIPLLVYVHPELLPPQPVSQTWGGGGADELPIAGQGGTLRELRPYVLGDSPRRVHWPSSARHGELVVREDCHQGNPELILLLDTVSPPGPEFEAALSRAASASRDALLSGHAVELRTPNLRLHLTRPTDLRRLLSALAAMAPAAEVRAGWDRVDPRRPCARVAPDRSGGAEQSQTVERAVAAAAL